MLCGTKYLFQHNKICKYIHWCILKDLNFNVPPTWHAHVPETTTVIGDTKVFWDYSIPTDKKVYHNRPDITIFETKKKEVQFIDVTVPSCRNITKI